MTKFIFLLLFPFLVFSQTITFSGKVVDAKTKEPLAGASIYVPNSSFGTMTDFDGNFSLQLSINLKEIVVSYMGYNTINSPLNLTEGTNVTKTILLRESVNKLKEIVLVKPVIDDKWKRQFSIFEANFIGKSELSKKAKILNKEDIYFEEFKDSSGYHLVAFANKPLQIINKATGYKVTYDLIEFKFTHDADHNNSIYFLGYMFFEDIVEKEKLNLKKINKNRLTAYKGSLQHFMKSIYNNTFEEEGFTVNQFIIKDNPDYPSKEKLKKMREEIKVNGITVLSPLPPKKLSILGRKYKNTDFVSTTNNEQFLDFKDYIYVNYKNAKPDANYPKDETTQFSYLSVSEKVQIFKDGFYYNPMHLTSYDYMGWKKVGDALPIDFEPETNP